MARSSDQESAVQEYRKPLEELVGLDWLIRREKTEDGKPCLAAEIKIEFGSGSLIASLVDHHEGRKLVVNCSKLQDALLALEKGLSGQNGVWLPYATRKAKPRPQK